MSQEEAALPSCSMEHVMSLGLRRVAPAGRDETDIHVQARRGEGQCTQEPLPQFCGRRSQAHLKHHVHTLPLS